MAAMRGMEVVVARPEGFALPTAVMDKARTAASAAGGSVSETADRAAALEGAHVVYAKEWGSTAHYGDAEADARLRAGLKDWCVREDWFDAAAPGAKLMHCLPVRRNVSVADEVLDGPRSAVKREARNRLTVQTAVLTACLRVPFEQEFQRSTSMIMSRPDPSVAVRALKSAAPYIRMYKNKVFVIKAGGAVFATMPRRAL